MINPTDLRKVTTHTRNLRDGVQGQVDAKMTVDTAAHIPNVIHFFCLCIWTYHSSYMKLSLIFNNFIFSSLYLFPIYHPPAVP